VTSSTVVMPTSFLDDPASPEDWRAMVLTNVYGPAITARAALYAVGQPPSVDVNEIVVRPTGQVWHR
jgi:NAD(P)-dependent dehydrogenase (short-subunit alcohol dehydrogenase family)